MTTTTASAPPFYVHLKDGSTPLPGEGYIRVVGQHLHPTHRIEMHSHYALRVCGARHCRLVEALLDAADLDTSSSLDLVRGPIPPVVLPQATPKGCERVFEYLEFLQNRLPSIISRPLRSPLEECIQTWEMAFLTGVCFGESISSSPPSVLTSSDALRKLLDGNSHSLDVLLEVAMLADFLLIDSLTDLTCAFIASLGLAVHSESDLLRLWGRSTPLTEEELQPVYAQLPFLKPSADN